MDFREARIRPRRSLGRFELPLTRFCDVAFHSYVELLSKERKDVLATFRQGDPVRCLNAVSKAKISVDNIKSAISEVEALKNEVTTPTDVEEFTRRIAPKKKKLEEEIMSLAKLMRNILVVESQSSDIEDGQMSTEFYSSRDWRAEQIFEAQQKLHDVEASVERRLELLEAYQNLEKDTEDVGIVMREISLLVHEQATAVDSIENNISVAEVNVEQGVKHVANAARLQVAAFPLAGALLGTCIGGPVGLLVGAKVGGIVALGGAAVGYISGKFVKETQTRRIAEDIASIPIDTSHGDYVLIGNSETQTVHTNTVK